MKATRRDFLRTSTALAVTGSALMKSSQLHAKNLSLPLGLQLYSVRDQLPKDFAGTLKQIGALGYREVESAGYNNHSAPDVKQALAAANLKLVSAHFPLDALKKNFDSILAFHKQLNVGTIVCSSPSHKDPSVKPKPGAPPFSLEDWRWNAEQFNTLGEKVHAAGMNFGYHNHFLEFHKVDGQVPYDELLRLTDPAKVTMEMDCGWVIVGGANPIDYLRKYPERISMLHVKDFNLNGPKTPGGEPKPVELGKGGIDYKPIFDEAAKSGHLKHVFAEQEAFTVPPMESLKIDATYLHQLGLG